MPQLPHARTWYVLGTLLTLAVIVASLLPLRAVSHLGMDDKLQHALAYTALALWFGGLMEPRRYGRLVLALMAMGVAIEIVQGVMGLGRQADAVDVAADAGGIAAGLALCLAGLRHWARWLEQWLSRA
jgi:VanZ family protein